MNQDNSWQWKRFLAMHSNKNDSWRVAMKMILRNGWQWKLFSVMGGNENDSWQWMAMKIILDVWQWKGFFAMVGTENYSRQWFAMKMILGEWQWWKLFFFVHFPLMQLVGQTDTRIHNETIALCQFCFKQDFIQQIIMFIGDGKFVALVFCG